MEAPVEIGDPHRVHGPLLGQLFHSRLIGKRIVRVFPRLRIVEVKQRLRDGKEEQADPDTRREQHGEPGEIGEFGPRIVVAQANIAVAAAHQVNADRQHNAERADIVPTQRRLDPTAHGRIDSIREIDVQRRENHESDDHPFRGQPHTAVQSCEKPRLRDHIRRVSAIVGHDRPPFVVNNTGSAKLKIDQVPIGLPLTEPTPIPRTI